MERLVWFTKQKKRFAVEYFSIVGLEADEIGSILIVRFFDDNPTFQRIPIDEDFDTAYNRINNLEEWNDRALKSA
jgi:hypothetical protein